MIVFIAPDRVSQKCVNLFREVRDEVLQIIAKNLREFRVYKNIISTFCSVLLSSKLLTSAVRRGETVQQLDNLACSLGVANQFIAHDVLLFLCRCSTLATRARTSTDTRSIDKVVPIVPDCNSGVGLCRQVLLQ